MWIQRNDIIDGPDIFDRNEATKNVNSIKNITITNKDLGTNITLNNFTFVILSVKININYDKNSRTILSAPINKFRQIIVYIKYNNELYTMKLESDNNEYVNLKATDLLLYTNNSTINKSYTLSIKSIDTNDQDWTNLVISLNEYIEQNIVYTKPTVNNLENHAEDLLTLGNKFTYYTPDRPKIDTYGVLNKNTKDNINRTINTIRQNIDNKNILFH